MKRDELMQKKMTRWLNKTHRLMSLKNVGKGVQQSAIDHWRHKPYEGAYDVQKTEL